MKEKIPTLAASRARASLHAPAWTKQSAYSWRTFLFTALAMGGLVGFGVLMMIINANSGGTNLLVPFLLALVPLCLVLLVVRWIDYQDPEPLGVLVAAFLWGAGVATLASLMVNNSSTIAVAEMTKSKAAGGTFATLVSAPLIEEFTKALGLVLIYLLWRKIVNGPVDGVVYATVIAGGFAFAENILYFARYSDQLAQIFLLRGVASPFAHVIFTACTGMALGFGIHMRGRWSWLGMTQLGYLCAVVLHFSWNLLSGPNWWFYMLVSAPIFVLMGLLVSYLKRREQRDYATNLMDYAAGGWYTSAEVAMLTTNTGRRQGTAWARSHGPQARKAMLDFQRDSMELAEIRGRFLAGEGDSEDRERQLKLLQEVSAKRQVFLGLDNA